jgi:hypothetical protein
MMRSAGIVLLLSCFVWACGSSEGLNYLETPDVPVTDQGPGDLGQDIEDVPGTDTTGEDTTVVDVPPVDTTDPDTSTTDEGGDTGPEDTFELPEFEDVAFPPRKLAFQFTRPEVGDPIPSEDVTAFTKRVAATLKDVGYFRWLLRTSTGVDKTTGTDDYLAWHNDLYAVKEGDTVTFNHTGGEHNMWINSSKVLASVLTAYLHTGDWETAKLTEQYCKGLTASIKGFVWGEDDPAPWLMARAIFPMDHEFTLDDENWKDDGRKKGSVFTPAYREEYNWNAESFAWPENPTWGSIWITNMRSKDDVRAISLVTTFLFYAAEDSPDAWVKDACAETLEAMINFHKDIVDEDYFIRTKDQNGVAYRLPCDDQKDLGSYSCFSELDPRNECCARLSADMIAYGERRTNDCGTCMGSVFDQFAAARHFYNIPIIWDYHMAGLGTSLVRRQHVDAYWTLVGLAERIDSYMHPVPGEAGTEDARWPSHMAYLLVEAASVGLPLTAFEARHVQKHWEQAVVELGAWDRWDLWDESIPDGTYSRSDFRPGTSNEAVPVQYFSILFQYCMSPFKNPAGASFVDCDVLKDPATWGVEE